jgi:predicted branched-subunit amino acid permease
MFCMMMWCFVVMMKEFWRSRQQRAEFYTSVCAQAACNQVIELDGRRWKD